MQGLDRWLETAVVSHDTSDVVKAEFEEMSRTVHVHLGFLLQEFPPVEKKYNIDHW